MTTQAMKRQAEPKERHIMFSGEMVRAVLDGTKTQTRRLNGLGEINENPDRYDSAWLWQPDDIWWDINGTDAIKRVKCPYGKPGDRLWFKETYSGGYTVRHENGERIKVPRFIPRNLSRITLEITNVRVERLQDISEEDALAEGFAREMAEIRRIESQWTLGEVHTISDDELKAKGPEWFEAKWEQINGKKYPWESNPFVWIIDFQKVGTTK